jgi:glycerol dehydrogenase-like iron-containing ADH family enzyme
MIAHTIEMKYPKLENLHGQVIAVTTLTAAELQKALLKFEPVGTRHEDALDRDTQKKLESFFGKKIAKACQKEYEEKISSIKNAKKISASLKKELQKIHLSESRLKEIFAHFKIKTSTKSLGLSNQQYQECVAFAKFTRNRFTSLDFS